MATLSQERRGTLKLTHTADGPALAASVPGDISREEFQQLQSDLRLAQQMADGLARERVRLERELALIGEAKTELESIATQLMPLNEVMDEYRMLDALAREEGRRKTLADALRTVTEELASLRSRQASLAATADSQEGVAAQLQAY